MKAHPRKGKNLIQLHQRVTHLFDELDLVRCGILQPVGKRYPLKAVRTLKKKREKTEKYFFSPYSDLFLMYFKKHTHFD